MDTLTPGVRSFASPAELTGTLTLNAEGNPDAVFVFQIGSKLTTAIRTTFAEPRCKRLMTDWDSAAPNVLAGAERFAHYGIDSLGG